MKTVSAKQLRQNLSDIVNDIYYNGEEVEFTYGRGEKMKRFSILLKTDSKIENKRVVSFLDKQKKISSKLPPINPNTDINKLYNERKI